MLLLQWPLTSQGLLPVLVSWPVHCSGVLDPLRCSSSQPTLFIPAYTRSYCASELFYCLWCLWGTPAPSALLMLHTPGNNSVSGCSNSLMLWMMRGDRQVCQHKHRHNILLYKIAVMLTLPYCTGHIIQSQSLWPGRSRAVLLNFCPVHPFTIWPHSVDPSSYTVKYLVNKMQEFEMVIVHNQ